MLKQLDLFCPYTPPPEYLKPNPIIFTKIDYRKLVVTFVRTYAGHHKKDYQLCWHKVQDAFGPIEANKGESFIDAVDRLGRCRELYYRAVEALK